MDTEPAAGLYQSDEQYGEESSGRDGSGDLRQWLRDAC